MKKLINIVLIIVAGAILGYVFHDPIDTKLKAKFGEENVKAGKANIERGGEKLVDAGKAFHSELNSEKE